MKYYNSDYKYISQSMLTTYIKDKELYKKMYIDRTESMKQTPSMEIGQAVETYVSDGRKQFLSAFQPRVKKREDPDLYELQKEGNDNITVMSRTNFDLSVKMAEKLLDIPDFKFLTENALKHVRLKCKYWDDDSLPELIGELDYLYLNKGKAVIADLKTSTTAEPNRFVYKARDYRYFLQASFYRMLLKKNRDDFNEFEFYFVVIDKDKLSPNINIMRVSDYELDIQEKFIKDKLSELKESIKTDNFENPKPSFKFASIIGDLKEE